MLVCCHPTVNYQLGLVDWREVSFVWLSHVLCCGSHVLFCFFKNIFKTLTTRCIFFSFALTKMEKDFLEWIAIKLGFSDNKKLIILLSPVFVTVIHYHQYFGSGYAIFLYKCNFLYFVLVLLFGLCNVTKNYWNKSQYYDHSNHLLPILLWEQYF